MIRTKKSNWRIGRILVKFILVCALHLAAGSAGFCEDQNDPASKSVPEQVEIDSEKVLGWEATALIVSSGKSLGTAFCIHPDGWYVSNAPIFSSVELGSPIQLLIPTNQPTPNSVGARIVRRDDHLKLALIKLDRAGKDETAVPAFRIIADDLPSPNSQLAIYACSPTDSNSSVSIETKKVEPLQIDFGNGRWDLPQTDPPLRAIDSGSPVVDPQGKLVGMVEFKETPPSAAQLILVKEILTFLSKRSVIVTPSKVEYKAARNPVDFNFELIEIEKSPPLWHLSFTVHRPNGTGLGNGVDPQKKGWSISLPPAARNENKQLKLRQIVPVGMGTLKADLEDRLIQVGTESIALQDIRRIERLPAHHKIITIDGKERTGKISGLSSLVAVHGGPIDPLIADYIDFQIVEPLPHAYDYTAHLKFDGIHEFTQKGKISLLNAPCSIFTSLNDATDPHASPLNSLVIETFVVGQAEFVLTENQIQVLHKSGSQLPGENLGWNDNSTTIWLNEYPWAVDWEPLNEEGKPERKSVVLPLKWGNPQFDVQVLSVRTERTGPPSQGRGTVASHIHHDRLEISIDDTAEAGGWYRVALTRLIPPPARVWEPLPALWNFDETSGSPLSGYENYWPGQFIPDEAPERRVPGAGGSVLRLDGKTIVDCGNAADVDSHDRFSIGCWILPDPNKDMVCIAKMEPEAKRGWELGISKGKAVVRLVHATEAPSLNAVQIESNRKLADGQWHFVLFTSDGTGTAKGVNLFIDGRRESVRPQHDTLRGTIRTSAPFQIGGRYRNPEYLGLIDDVRFETRPLNAEEVAGLYDLSRERYGAPKVAVVKPEPAGIVKIPTGVWRVRYSNSAEREYRFQELNRVEFSGMEGKLSFRNRDLLLSFEDGKLERLNFDGRRIFFEHYPDQNQYQNSTAAILGIGVYEGDLPEIAPDPDRIAHLKGKWKVHYTNQGIRHYEFEEDGSARVSESLGKFYIKNRDLLVDINDGKLERATLVGNRLFLEHYNPSTTYPLEFPVIIGVGQRE